MRSGLMKKKDEEPAGEIDLTPMLDVVFILLIFFIVTSVFITEAGIDGVVVMFYTGGGRSEDLIKNNYYASYIGTGLGYSWAAPHFVSVYEIRRGDEIAAFKTSAYVESSYHDLRNGNAVWRIITQTKDTEHTDTAEAVARHIASQMSKFGLN